MLLKMIIKLKKGVLMLENKKITKMKKILDKAGYKFVHIGGCVDIPGYKLKRATLMDTGHESVNEINCNDFYNSVVCEKECSWEEHQYMIDEITSHNKFIIMLDSSEYNPSDSISTLEIAIKPSMNNEEHLCLMTDTDDMLVVLCGEK